jgi:hypothetical protein
MASATIGKPHHVFPHQPEIGVGLGRSHLPVHANPSGGRRRCSADKQCETEVAPELDLLTLERLHRKGWLAAEPNPPVRSVCLTPEGVRRAHALFKQMLCD